MAQAKPTQEISDKRSVFIVRVIIGLLTGLALYALLLGELESLLSGLSQEDRIASVQTAIIFLLIIPFPIIFGIGRLPVILLTLWSVLAGATVIAVSWYASSPVWNGTSPLGSVWLFSLITVFIGHEFVQSAYDDKRPIAKYETYFENAWRHGFQVVLAFGFLAAFWLVLALGTSLFDLIGIAGLGKFLFSAGFAWPASTTALAAAIHWTDDGSTLTRGVRQTGLSMLSWLLILITLILSAFLLTLPFTGLEPLWDTRFATVILLNAGAAAILLINASFQSGIPPKSALIRAIVRFSAAPLLGIVVLATIGLWLRIDQYGFTPARVLASAQLLIIALHAAGYAAASVWPGPWMALIKPVNIASAAATAFILLALMSPLADPAKVSVANQIARLDRGQVEPDDFDFGFLADERSGPYGKAALETLSKRQGDPRNERIALLAQNPGNQKRNIGVQQNINLRRASVRPIGFDAIPDALLLPSEQYDPITDCVAYRKTWLQEKIRQDETVSKTGNRQNHRQAADQQYDRRGPCAARLIDINSDGKRDFLLWKVRDDEWHRDASLTSIVAYLAEDEDRWQLAGGYNASTMNGLHLRSAVSPILNDKERRERWSQMIELAKPVPPTYNDIMLNGQRVRLLPRQVTLNEKTLLSRLSTLDDRKAPLSIAGMNVYDPILADCTRQTEISALCFGLYINADQDSREEYLIFAKNRFEPSVKLQLFDIENTIWQQAARGALVKPSKASKANDSLNQLFKDLDEETIEKSESIISISPPLIKDLDVGLGERIVFDYWPDYIQKADKTKTARPE